jgi:hypothetical protein
MLAIGLAPIDICPGGTVDDDVRALSGQSSLDCGRVRDIKRCVIESHDSLTFACDM